MDGIETARRLKALDLPNSPFIVMATAHGREEVLREARSVGIANVLIKPVNPSMLFDTTMDVLGLDHAQPARAPLADTRAEPKPGAGQGARILLVEDNDINQHVASEILMDAGFVVEVAENGRIALDLVQQRSFDAVLMDMQMPVMDGVTATREIRKLPAFSALPIIAMTANAMQSDRQRCMDSGMNDFVTKPIDPETLAGTVRTWVERAGRARETAAVSPAIAPPAIAAPAAACDADLVCPALRNVPGLDVTTGLRRMMNKKPLYLAMLKRYVQSQRDCPAQLWQATEMADWATAERLAHTAKGLAGNIGADALATTAEALENTLREKRPLEEIEPRHREFAQGIKALTDALAEALPA
jgi:two-component system sensor histidine kinase/response regulator